jgi:TRAP-type C4-dicarboxylate transport system substrate-binding protein
MHRMHIVLAAAIACAASAASAQEVFLLPTLTPPNSHVTVRVLKPWAARVAEASDGKLTIDVRDGISLANPRNIYDRVMSDVVQAGWALHNYIPGQYRLSEIGALPYVVDRTQYTAEQASVALWRVYKSGLLDAEYADVVPFGLTVLTQSQLHLAKPLRSLDSLAGLKIIGPAPSYAKVILGLGGAPVSFANNEFYDAMQRGAADGLVTGFTAFPSFRLEEVTSYHVDTSLGTASGMLFMAKKKYAALPASTRAALDKTAGEVPSRDFGRSFDRTDEEVRAAMKASPKHTVVDLSPAQTEAWRRKIAPAIDELLNERPGGRQVLEAFQRNLAEAKAGR